MTGGPSTFDQGLRGVARCLPARSNPPGYGALGLAPAGRRSRFRFWRKTIGFREFFPCAADISATRLRSVGGYRRNGSLSRAPGLYGASFTLDCPHPPHRPRPLPGSDSPYVTANLQFSTRPTDPARRGTRRRSKALFLGGSYRGPRLLDRRTGVLDSTISPAFTICTLAKERSS